MWWGIVPARLQINEDRIIFNWSGVVAAGRFAAAVGGDDVLDGDSVIVDGAGRSGEERT